MLFRRALCAICCLIFLSLTAHAKGGDEAQNLAKRLKKDVKTFTLPNGMTWFFMKRDASPVFSGIVMVRAGGIEEENGKTGLAHMLEHMAFKGTNEITPQELWDAFVTNGAEGLNAYTSKDATAYHSSMPASKLELWLYLNSEMVKSTSELDFYKERGVVLEERLSSVENNPRGSMFVKLLSTAFEKSPYRWPTIGSKEDVAKLEPADLLVFKKKFYTANRMTGVLVGDINISEAKKLVAKYFGDIPKGSSAVEKIPVEPKQTSERREIVKFKASPNLMMAWHKPNAPHRDDYVFDVLDYIMCEGDAALLKKRLVFEKKIAQSVACDSSTPGSRLENVFVIFAAPLDGATYAELIGEIDSVIETIAADGVSEADLSRARNNVAKGFASEMSTNEGIAHSIAYFQTITGDWRYIADHSSKIQAIGADEIKRVAKEYLGKDKRTIVELKK